MALRPEGDQRPVPRPVSNRRHGAPAPSSPSMTAARRSRAAWSASEPRQSTVNTPPAAFSQPRAGLDTARRRPARPGSSCIGAQTGLRAAIDPPSCPRIVAARAPVARSAQLRPVRSALSRLSAAHRRSVRCDLALNPALGGPCRCLSGPLAAAQAARQPPAPTLRDPRHPHPGPPLSSRRGERRLGYICPRVRRGNFQKENQREGEPSAPPPSGLRSVPGAAGAKGHRFPCQRV